MRMSLMVAEMCGAVIGAGFASGKEVAGFFARYGAWSWAGVAVACLVMGWLCLRIMEHPGMPEGWLGRLWQIMLAALMLVTGGAMLAGGGEIAALLLPVHGARWLGLGVTLMLSVWLAARPNRLLGRVSQGLLVCLVAVVILGLTLDPMQGADIAGGGVESIVRGLCYGGFNLALAAPVIGAMGAGLTKQERRRCALCFTLVMAALLCLGNAVLLRHTALLGEELPFIVMLSAWGRTGHVLGGAALYLAALTTLTACLRGVTLLLPRWRWLAVAGVGVLSLTGLDALVGVAYPVLGGGCFLMLAAAQLKQNC